MNKILRCDRLPERAKWRYLALSGLLAVPRKNCAIVRFCFHSYDNRPNRLFAGSVHMAQNHTYWWASCSVGLSKQRQVQVGWCELHCFGSCAVQLAHQHEWFCTMWPDRAKGLLDLTQFFYHYVSINFKNMQRQTEIVFVVKLQTSRRV